MSRFLFSAIRRDALPLDIDELEGRRARLDVLRLAYAAALDQRRGASSEKEFTWSRTSSSLSEIRTASLSKFSSAGFILGPIARKTFSSVGSTLAIPQMISPWLTSATLWKVLIIRFTNSSLYGIVRSFFRKPAPSAESALPVQTLPFSRPDGWYRVTAGEAVFVPFRQQPDVEPPPAKDNVVRLPLVRRLSGLRRLARLRSDIVIDLLSWKGWGL